MKKSKVYYNENDPFAAKWLEELIKEGLIAWATWTPEALKKLNRPSLLGISSTTSLPESEGGPTRSGSQAGPMIEKSGQEAAPVNPSQQRENDWVRMIRATSGRTSSSSSKSKSLQRSLENRLRVRMEGSGSPEYELIWKWWAMPLGQPILAQRASERHISGSGFTGWPTPTTRDGRPLKGALDRPGKKGGPSLSHLVLKGWASPRTNKFGNGDSHGNYQKPLNAKMAGVELNPHFNRWLLGYPPEWFNAAVTAMQSFPKSRRSSS